MVDPKNSDIESLIEELDSANITTGSEVESYLECLCVKYNLPNKYYSLIDSEKDFLTEKEMELYQKTIFNESLNSHLPGKFYWGFGLDVQNKEYYLPLLHKIADYASKQIKKKHSDNEGVKFDFLRHNLESYFGKSFTREYPVPEGRFGSGNIEDMTNLGILNKPHKEYPTLLDDLDEVLFNKQEGLLFKYLDKEKSKREDYPIFFLSEKMGESLCDYAVFFEGFNKKIKETTETTYSINPYS